MKSKREDSMADNSYRSAKEILDFINKLDPQERAELESYLQNNACIDKSHMRKAHNKRKRSR